MGMGTWYVGSMLFFLPNTHGIKTTQHKPNHLPIAGPGAQDAPEGADARAGTRQAIRVL